MLLYQKSVQNKIKLYIKLKYNLPKHKLPFNLKCVHECVYVFVCGLAILLFIKSHSYYVYSLYICISIDDVS